MTRALSPISRTDREHILTHAATAWRDLAGARLFITGGTGFYGKWLLESIAAANDQLGVKIRATILTRKLSRFNKEVPHLATRPEFDWLEGDVANFAFPTGHFDFIFHFATPSATEVGTGETAPLMAGLLGTEHVLQFARICGARRLLFASSGAVYGTQPQELSHIPEDFTGGPCLATPASMYGEMKRISELMCISSEHVECVVTRGFSFVGPYLPLTDKFAIGSFIRDVLAGGPIRIHGDGTPVRSYLYAADLAVWLLTLLVSGKPTEAYNVGSNQAINLAKLADATAATTDGVTVDITRTARMEPPERYVPDTQKARDALGLEVLIPLASCLQRTIDWKSQWT